MKYNELFGTDEGKVKLFDGIFKERYPVIYAEIFADTKADIFALMKFGERELLANMTESNVTGYTGAILDMCVDSFKYIWDTFNKKYDFLKPVVDGTQTNTQVTLQETNTDGVVKSDKAFEDNDFFNDSKEDKTADKERTETTASTVEHTGITGNVTEAMLKEYQARKISVREEIISSLVGYITLSIY